jgi:hypothetical protein
MAPERPSDGGGTGSGGTGASGASGNGDANGSGGAAGMQSTGGTQGGGGGVGNGGGAGNGGSAGGGGTAMSLVTPGQVPLDHTPELTGITAAAWGGDYFFLLEPGAHQFWQVEPDTGSVTGPFALPNVMLVPHAFGASREFVYVVGVNKAYRVPRAGSTTTPGANLATTVSETAIGAYANGYLLIGDAQGTKTAQVFSDDTGTVSTATKIGAIFAVASDGLNFAFTTLGSQMLVNAVPSGPGMAANAAPCSGGSVMAMDYPVSISGQTVAWVVTAGNYMQVTFATIAQGSCAEKMLDRVLFGKPGKGAPPVVGLINDNQALVFDSYESGSGDMRLVERRGGATPPFTVKLGGQKYPTAIVVGEQHYAFIVADNAPAMIHF